MTAATASRSQVVILGIGGQGILFVTRLMAEAADLAGWDVIASETHGMSQRGGAVDSHVRFGGFQGPLVRRGMADAALALDPLRLADARSYVKPGGTCFANAAAADGARAFDAAAVARELAAPRAANIALAGFAAATLPDVFPPRGALLAAIEKLSPPKALDANRRAFLRGTERA